MFIISIPTWLLIYVAESSVAASASFSTVFINLTPLLNIAAGWEIGRVAFISVRAGAEVPAVFI